MDSSCSKKTNVEKFPLHYPSLDEVAKVLEDGLRKNFADVDVSVVDCPDLSQPPFHLAASGLCGNPRITDVGGVPNLVPLVNRDKVYNLEKVAEMCDLSSGSLMGAGAGPNREIGVNCEMMANIKVENGAVQNDTYVCRINPQDGSYIVSQPKNYRFCTFREFLHF